ncbi:glycosyltransferase family 4 protein, partial [Candidatus Pacearchaeota archaeon]|nr:glycosyltransferase family 4 protein [Candidatus Pacearchaeota archaeon]
VKCILALLAKMVGAKTILHVHGAEFKEFYANMSGIACYLTRRLINANSAVIALSAEWREFFVSIGVIREKIVVMLNSIFLPDIAETKTVPEKLTVLFLSRLEKRKGIHELVTAIEEQSDLSKKYRFVLAGPKANEWHAVQKRIGRLPLSNTVEMPGLLVGKDKDIAYRQADIYVLQSYAEGLPIGLLEAMSYGLACITTPVGGIPDLIINGKNGLLVRPGSAEDLANALARLAQEPELRAKLGKEARSTVEKEYDWTIRAEQITELYYNLKQLGKTNC